MIVLAVTLSPHIGIFLLSIATVWSYAVLPDGFTLAHYATVFHEAGPLIRNTLIYCGLAGLIDVILGAMLAYVVLRTRLPGRRLVEQVAMSAVAVPGLVLGIGLLRTYYDVKLPFSGESLATFWFMLVIAYAVRRLPYALAAATAALQQVHVSLEEAAENLGAGKFSTLTRIVVPLMTGGLLAGFVTSFATAAVELSATLLLVARSGDAPIAYGIYVYMQSAAGRGPGAALGVIAVAVVAVATYLAYRVRRARAWPQIARAVLMTGVRIEHVTFGYGPTPVLDDISLDVARAEFFAFLGPSGSGKTTLLRLIAGFGTPARGRIRIGERDMTWQPPWSRNVGMVFQSYALWPHMSVARNVAFGLERRKLSRREIGRRVRAALDLVGLEELADRRPAQLSGGQQQRVALARTLVIEPDVLLLDEPLSNLDAKLRVEMRAELKALQRKLGITAIYVTHDQEEANAIADRIAVLDQGRIQQIGAPIDLYDRPANRFVATFLGTANLIDGSIEPGGRFVAEDFALEGIGGAAGRACLSIRPQDITFTSPGAGFEAVVTEREFLGSVTRYRVRLARHVIIVDVPHRRDGLTHGVAEKVGLVVDPRQVAVLR